MNQTVNKQLLGAAKNVSEKLEGKSFVGNDLRDDLRVAIAAAEQAQQAEPVALEPVEGDLLPAIGDTVLIHLSRPEGWFPHRVVGYYVWGNLRGSKHLYRVFVRVVDAKGYPNARPLDAIRRLGDETAQPPAVAVPSRMSYKNATQEFADGYNACIDAILAAVPQATAEDSSVVRDAGGVPDGYALVPIKPTDSMLDAAVSAGDEPGSDYYTIYAAMLAASPQGAVTCASQTANSEAQASLCRNGEAQECDCNASNEPGQVTALNSLKPDQQHDNAPPAPDVIDMNDPANWQEGDIVLRIAYDWMNFVEGCEYKVHIVRTEKQEVYIGRRDGLCIGYTFDMLRPLFKWLRHGDCGVQQKGGA